MSDLTSGPDSFPLSTSSASPGQGWTITSTFPPYIETSCSNRTVTSVWAVASTPMTPDLVDMAAGLTAGSIAIIGTVVSARNASTATPVAVLHATTTAFTLQF